MSNEDQSGRGWRAGAPWRWFKIAAINLLVLAAAVEALGLVWYFHEHRQCYYTRPVQSRAGGTVSPELTLGSRIDPYFGYSYFPDRPGVTPAARPFVARQRMGETGPPDWLDVRTNRAGFYSRVEYPYAKTDPREFVIGIFGGSVGSYFSRQGRKRLVEALQGLPQFADRKIVVLNFSIDAGRQPQQLQVLTYFLTMGQRFDYLVNIDGFNEVVAGLRNLTYHVDPGLPSFGELIPLIEATRALEMNPDALDRLRRLKLARRRLDRIAAWQARSPSAGLALLLGLARRRAEEVVWSYYDLTPERASPAELRASAYALTFSALEAGSKEGLDHLFDEWRRSAVLMNAVARARGIGYLEVLQPNQYYSHKTFSPFEQRIALVNQRDGTAQALREPGYVRRGYARFPALVEELRAQGVNVRSAVPLFDDIAEPTYADTSCHYNQRGNDVLADFVATALKEDLSR